MTKAERRHNRALLKAIIWRWLKNNFGSYRDGIEDLLDNILSLYDDNISIAEQNILDDVQKFKDIDTIIEKFCDKSGIGYNVLMGKTKRHEVSIPRHLLAYHLAKYTGASDRAIGEKMGGRNHSTINNSRKESANLLDSKHAAAVKFDKICKEIINEM